MYLFHGDTDEQVETWLRQPYGEGHLAFLPNDTWWGPKGLDIQPGMNQTQPFFFVLVPNGTNVESGVSQATFTATRMFIIKTALYSAVILTVLHRNKLTNVSPRR